MKSQALQHAIENLGVVEIAPNRYAIREGARWKVFPGFAWAGQSFGHYPGVTMPEWWSPDTQTRIRNTKTGRVYPKGTYWTSEHTKRFTVNLETGEEVPVKK